MTLIDKAEAHDDDLIRRGDALAAIQLGDTVTKLQARISAIPARGVGVKPLVWFEKPQGQDCRIGRCEHIAYAVERRGDFWGFRRSGENGLVVAVGAENAFRTEAEAMAGADRDHIKRILAAFAPTDAAQARARFETEVNADLRGKFTDEELRLAADVLRRFRGQMNEPAEAMSLGTPTDADNK